MKSKIFELILILAIVFAGCSEAGRDGNEEPEKDEDGVVEQCKTTINENQIIPCIKSAELTEKDKEILDEHLSKYAAFSMDTKELANFAKSKEGETFQLRIQIDEELDWTIDLKLYDRQAPELSIPDGVYSFGSPYFGVDTYMGITSDGHKVRLGFDEERFFGVILNDTGRYIIRLARDYAQISTVNTFIVYHGYEDFWEDYPPEFIPRSIEFLGYYKRSFSFIEAVSRYLYNDSVYVIKGIALDTFEYGRYIRLVEDLKGNFPENDDTFIVWGRGFDSGGAIGHESRLDHLLEYDNNDVLIMLLTTHDYYMATYWERLKVELITGIPFIEKPGDYRTIGFTSCILKLSDNCVTGRLIYPWDEMYYDWDKEEWNMNSVPWNEFYEKLQEVLYQ